MVLIVYARLFAHSTSHFKRRPTGASSRRLLSGRLSYRQAAAHMRTLFADVLNQRAAKVRREFEEHQPRATYLQRTMTWLGVYNTLAWLRPITPPQRSRPTAILIPRRFPDKLRDAPLGRGGNTTWFRTFRSTMYCMLEMER